MVTVVVAVVEGWVEAGDGEAVGGEGGPADASCCNSVVLVAFSCCCFFFTSCSADLRSSSVTPAIKQVGHLLSIMIGLQRHLECFALSL